VRWFPKGLESGLCSIQAAHNRLMLLSTDEPGRFLVCIVEFMTICECHDASLQTEQQQRQQKLAADMQAASHAVLQQEQQERDQQQQQQQHACGAMGPPPPMQPLGGGEQRGPDSARGAGAGGSLGGGGGGAHSQPCAGAAPAAHAGGPPLPHHNMPGAPGLQASGGAGADTPAPWAFRLPAGSGGLAGRSAPPAGLMGTSPSYSMGGSASMEFSAAEASDSSVSDGESDGAQLRFSWLVCDFKARCSGPVAANLV